MIRNCFGSLTKRTGVHECVFCDYVAGRKERELLYSDDRVVVFRSRTPVAAEHLLVVPREHLGTVHELRPSDYDLIKHMEDVGRKTLSTIPPPPDSPHHAAVPGGPVFGFHRPPFNSVHHLHLHCIKPPWRQPWQPIRFQPGTLWFTTVGALLRRLGGSSGPGGRV
uniref:HIT domain-containing protein n=1 Tax=Hemiselmis andersenii TaxID=464988 RepID=A0A7S1DS35_HEMAN|mmetsp:Transcript_25846/g.62711  ORF Transcript_25846/g.62711 Transcript_25846/m.62711 type:complete len:166 (+) Transcript_25846:60-557(+)